MKRDIDKFKRLMKDFDITGMRSCMEHDSDETRYVIEVGCCDKVHGYSGFEVEFKFNESGKFINMGVWE